MEMTTKQQLDHMKATNSSDLSLMAAYHTNPTAQTAVIVHVAPRWIPVGERLPEAIGRAAKTSLLVTIVRGDSAVSFGHLVVTVERGPYWFDDYLRQKVTVTHWQPLPPLPDEADGPTTLDRITKAACERAKRGGGQ